MRLFIDGARIGAALAALDVTLREMVAQTGVDAFTIGGTKAGAMFGEAVVFTDGALLAAGDYILKQSMQHFDKSKFLGAQMTALFKEDRWIANFRHANRMAKLLEVELQKKGIGIYYPTESNMVFCVMEKETLERIGEKYDLKYWYKDRKVVRLATTFSTTEAQVMDLISLI